MPTSDSGIVRALAYQQAVLDGSRQASRWERAAVERHVNDLDRDDWEWTFDASRGARWIRWCESFNFTKGAEFGGKPLRLSPWQCWITMVVFGWVGKATGIRRFRVAYVEVPRKNGKTEWAAALGLGLLCADGEHGAEVVIAATTMFQAKNLYKRAQRMSSLSKDFRKHYGIKVTGGEHHAGSISEKHTLGEMYPVAWDRAGSLDGLHVSGALIDELHAHPTRAVWDALETGMGSRLQPLLWAITTAGVQARSIGWEQHRLALRVLGGDVEAERHFAIVYTMDDGDDWQAPETWHKANPNLGVSIYESGLAALAEAARASPTAQAAFLTKHLNVWITGDQAWMDMRGLDKCKTPIEWEDFEGRRIWISLDASTRKDVTSLCYTYHADGRWYSKWRHWLPERAVEESKVEEYAAWARKGLLEITPGAQTDYAAILAQLTEDFERFDVAGFGYDQWQSQMLANELAELAEHVPIIEVPQTVRVLSEPMRMWEAAVADDAYRWDGDEIARWMIANVMAKPDHNGNIFPRRDRARADTAKIDAAVTQLMNLVIADPATELAPLHQSFRSREELLRAGMTEAELDVLGIGVLDDGDS